MSDNLRILLLEDNIDDADIVFRLLKKTSLEFESRLALNRAEFLAALDDFEPNVILSDNSLPQFNATEALQIVRERGIHAPFILVTGTVSEEFAANIIKLGADDYILKDRLTRLPGAIQATLEKKEAEAQVREREERLRFKASLLAAVGQAIIATDPEGVVIYWNAVAEKIYGWTAAEAMGKNLRELAPSTKNQEAPGKVMEFMKEGDSWSGEYIVQKKDGSSFTAFITDSPVFGNNGKLNAIISVSTDISERKNAERELKLMEDQISNQRIEEQKKITRAIIRAQEQERNHIGQELHDNVTQILAGTKLFLEVAAQKNETVMEMTKYPLKLLTDSIEEIRLLSARHVTPLKNINLGNLIEKLIDNLSKTTKIKTEFIFKVVTHSIDDELKLNIYRIIQEQVNNIIKHSLAQTVRILLEESDGHIHIEVSDDGRGFDVAQKRNGIGISNMMNRIESFNGRMELKAAPGEGCKIRVSMPVLAVATTG